MRVQRNEDSVVLTRGPKRTRFTQDTQVLYPGENFWGSSTESRESEMGLGTRIPETATYTRTEMGVLTETQGPQDLLGDTQETRVPLPTPDVRSADPEKVGTKGLRI